MRRHVGLMLLAVNTLLALVLAWLWVSPDGSLKNVHWSAPKAQMSNLRDLIPALGKPVPMDQSQFLAMLDRPLFSPTRRPPPPPPRAPERKPPTSRGWASITSATN